MSIFRYCCLLVLMLVFLVAATPAPQATTDSAGDLERNRQLLQKWKGDPEHYARLQRDLHDFWALPEPKRQHLRRLDGAFHQLDARTRKKLWKAAERYVAWLERLPEAERRQIEETEDARDRLRAIRTIRQRQSRERLHLKKFAENQLLPHLTPEERRRYDASLGRWPQYRRTLRELAKHHPVLPPLPPPHKPIARFDDLPDQAKIEAGSKPSWEKRADAWDALQRVEGKWPEWALTFHSLLSPQQRRRMLPLGASRPNDFPPEVREFIWKTLKPTVGPIEWQELENARGRWPDYPLHLLRLAEKHQLEVPGMSLPAGADW